MQVAQISRLSRKSGELVSAGRELVSGVRELVSELRYSSVGGCSIFPSEREGELPAYDYLSIICSSDACLVGSQSCSSLTGVREQLDLSRYMAKLAKRKKPTAKLAKRKITREAEEATRRSGRSPASEESQGTAADILPDPPVEEEALPGPPDPFVEEEAPAGPLHPLAEEEAPAGPPLTAAERSALSKKMAACKYCLVCQRWRVGCYEHKSRSGHEWRDLEDDEEREARSTLLAEIRGGPAVRRARLKRQRDELKNTWVPPANMPERMRGWDFIVDFGSSKYKGKSLREVHRAYPNYLQHLVDCHYVDARPTLKEALQEAELLEELERNAGPSRMAKAQKKLETIALLDPLSQHPEQRELSAIQVEESVATLTSDGLQGPGVPVPEANLEVGRPEKASRPRKRDSAPTSFIPHCSKCGCVEHKISRCPSLARSLSSRTSANGLRDRSG